MMRRFRGSVVSEGLAKGEVFIITSGEIRVQERRVDETKRGAEVERFEKAVLLARKDIAEIAAKAESQLNKDVSGVVSSLLVFLEDQVGLLDPIRRLIREDGLDAPSAVTRRFQELVQEFKALPEPLPSRVGDLLDLERRLVARVMGRRWTTRVDRLPRKVIIVAEDLTPTQTAALDRSRVLGIVTDRGGPASHTAILARQLGIPAVVGVGGIFRHARQGEQLLVDALGGEVILNPDSNSLHTWRVKQRRLNEQKRKLEGRTLEPVTLDGVTIQLMANIDRGESARKLVELGVDGVGLFRTEFLYLGRDDAPDEEDQVAHYRGLLESMAPHPVCFRTFDFGADKFEHRLGLVQEPNPFLGLRSIRLSFEHEELFRAQLRAILRASVVGEARIMFPLVSDLADFRRARRIMHEIEEDLRSTGIPFREDIPVGAMVEVPAAALTARNLCREADFLSIGTNDLTQYTLAVDRTNAQVAPLFKPHHPGVLRLMQMSIEAARERGRPVSACGEMAGAERYVPVLLGLGLRTLSMSAPRVFEVVNRIRALRVEDCRELALSMLTSDDAQEADAHLDAFLKRLPRRPPRR